MQEPPSRLRRAVRVAACVYLVFHLAALTVANVPRTTALGTGFHRPFDAYLGITGLLQTWDMFTTIPRFLDLDGSLVALNDRGEEVRYGPMLPGLARYRKDLRVHGAFLRMAFGGDAYSYYAARYLAAVCTAITRKEGQPPRLVGFELRGKQLRPLADVRRDGRMAETKTFRFGPATCVR